MNEQALHDEIINLVTTLKPVIQALQALITQTDEAMATRLDGAIERIDNKVEDVTSVIDKLGSNVSKSNQALSVYQNLVLKQLQDAVIAFTENEMPKRYDAKVSQLISDIGQQLESALNSIIVTKNVSLEQQTSSLQKIAATLEEKASTLSSFTDDYKIAHEQIVIDIQQFETKTAKRITQVEEEASEQLSKTYKAIESMSIKKMGAVFALGIIAMVLSFAVLIFWYLPSSADIAELRSQEKELQAGIEELQIGWKEALDNAQNAQIIIACRTDKDNPNDITWCVKADSKNFLRDENGMVYYPLANNK